MITLVNVTKRYNTSLILHNISCHIARGTTTLLLGSNGAGKSTLLHMIAGVEPVSSGNIIMGEECIGYIGHSSAMYPRCTALENLLFWQKLYSERVSQEACIAVLKDVNLYHARNKEVRYFSKGMLQRLHIASLLLQQPTLILLDEPSAGLDTASTLLLYAIIQQKQAQGISFLWITHMPSLDLPYATHVLLLEKRHITFHGSTQEYELYLQTEPS